MIERVIATDFCCFEDLDRKLAKQGLTFIQGDHRDTAAANSNGVGKTTLYKAVTWCLYGVTVDDMKGDEVIRLGTKEALVTVTLEDGDTTWYVTRTRRKGKPGLVVEWETSDEPGVLRKVKGDKDALQNKVLDLLGLDFRAFKNTVLYGQNDSFKFADPRTKDTARKDMLHRICRTEPLQDCHVVAKERYKRQRKELDEVQNELARIDTQVEAIDLPVISTRRDEWEDQRTARTDQQTEAARRYKREAERMLRDAPDTAAMDERMAKMRTRYDAKKAAGEGLADVTVRVKELRAKFREHERAEAEATAEAGQYNKQIKRLKGDRCPTCTAPLNKGAPKGHIASLHEQAGHYDGLATAAATNKAEVAKQGKDAAAEQEAAEAANEAASDLRDDMDDLRDELEEAKGIEAEAETLIDKACQAVKDAKAIRAEANPHDEALRVAESKVKVLVAEGEAHEDRRTELSEAAAYTQFWVRGYSPQGLPSFVLDAVMPFLTDRTNEYLETLADGDITMSISTQRELKSQKDAVKDEISIEWNIEGNEGVAKSGGQRTRMNLAMDMALMDLAATREGITLDLLMIDEALDGMDKVGTARAIQVLQKLRKRRGSIFVISHSDDMSEMFEHGLVVVREDGVSRVEDIR